jgi:hypothetical protein
MNLEADCKPPMKGTCMEPVPSTEAESSTSAAKMGMVDNIICLKQIMTMGQAGGGKKGISGFLSSNHVDIQYRLN